MKTVELVDQLIVLHNGWDRDGSHGVLQYLNMANRLLLSCDAEQNIILEDGELPAIDTDGSMSYDVDGRRVAAVVVKSDDITTSNDYGTRMPTAQTEFIFGGVLYAKIPYVKTFDRKSSTVSAKVVFTKDPGTTSDYYRVVMYQVPTDILSERIQHDIKEPYDLMYLLPAASALIAGIQNFTLTESIQYVRDVLLRDYSKELGEGDQGDMDFEPVARDF